MLMGKPSAPVAMPAALPKLQIPHEHVRRRTMLAYSELGPPGGMRATTLSV